MPVDHHRRSRVWRRQRCRLGLAVAPLLLLASPAAAQAQRTSLELLVVDAGTAVPIAGARVVDEATGRRLLSDAEGRVEFTAGAGDSLVLELTMLGYAARSLTVAPPAGAPLILTVPLELAPVLLPGVRVRAPARRPRSRMLEDFYARAGRGTGVYLTREEIESRRVRDLGDLFRTLPGIALSATAFGESPVMEAKGSVLPDHQGGVCSVQYFLDGTPIRPPEGAIGFDVDLRDVEGIEIYRRGTSVPAQFQRQHGSCGVILIWKRESLDG